MDIDLFGYEDLLHELARNEIKIQLGIVQKAVFGHGGVEEVFEYDGDPQIKVWSRFKDGEAFKRHEYIEFVLNSHLLFISFSI